MIKFALQILSILVAINSQIKSFSNVVLKPEISPVFTPTLFSRLTVEKGIRYIGNFTINLYDLQSNNIAF